MLGVGTTLKVEEPMTSVACACTSDGVELATATAATSNKNLFTVTAPFKWSICTADRHVIAGWPIRLSPECHAEMNYC
jgi:hypothetical protein